MGSKYWGEKTLHRIVSQLEVTIKRNEATRNIDNIQYARILVDVKIEQEFSNYLYFINEYESVFYGWKPSKCTNCNKLGHVSMECRVKKSAQSMDA